MPASRTRNCSNVVVRSRMVSDMGSISYLMKMPVGEQQSAQSSSLLAFVSLTRYASPVFRHAAHISHRVLTRVEEATASVDVGRRYDADKVLEDVEVCAPREG